MDIEIKHVSKQEFQKKFVEKKNKPLASVSIPYLFFSIVLSIISYIGFLFSFGDGGYIVVAISCSLLGTIFSIYSLTTIHLNLTQLFKSIIIFFASISIFIFSLYCSLISLSLAFL